MCCVKIMSGAKASSSADYIVSGKDLKAYQTTDSGSFMGISISSMGTSNRRHKNPFLKLKNIAMDETKEPEDRMQAVRYMNKIPHVDMVRHTVEAAMSIVSNDDVPIGQRYFFFSNTEKYIRLESHVIQQCHFNFFKMSRGRTEYPLIHRLMSANFIYTTVAIGEDVWQDAREFIISLALDENETVHIRSEAADILCRRIVHIDCITGEKVIAELGLLYGDDKVNTIYTNAQNVHDETITESVMNAIRTLAAEKKRIERELRIRNPDVNSFSGAALGLGNVVTSELIYTKLSSLLKGKKDDDYKNSVFAAFGHIIVYPAKYEGLCLSDILILVWGKIQLQKDDVRTELEQRLIEELHDMNETCGSGYVTRLVNILSGYIDDAQLSIRMSITEQLKSNVLARLSSNLKYMSQTDQDIILEEIATDSSDKEYAKEFVESCDVRDELWSEFVGGGFIQSEMFETVYDKCVNNFLGL